eukprot:1149414-Alexandrium_andersonii.AAC.1
MRSLEVFQKAESAPSLCDSRGAEPKFSPVEFDPVRGLRGEGLVAAARPPAHDVPPAVPKSAWEARGDGASHVVLVQVVPCAFHREHEVPGM